MKNIVIASTFILVCLFGISCSKADDSTRDDPDTIGNETIISFGAKKIKTDIYTSGGGPVVPMWTYKMPTTDYANGAGFEKPASAEHSVVWQPKTREEGAFNHFVALTTFNGKQYIMWGNHPFGEDAPGQRILISSSASWGSWSAPGELFPPPCPVVPEAETNNGPHLTPDRWVIADGNLYAVVYVHSANWRYPIARQVNADDTFGKFFLVTNMPSNAQLPDFMKEDPDAFKVPAIGAKILQWYKDNDQISWWANANDGIQRPGVGGESLIETFMYRANDNSLILMFRNHGIPSNPVHNNRIYVTMNNGSGGWTTPYPTDIPDAPSRSEVVKGPDGMIYLIGNQIVFPFDQTRYLDSDLIKVSVSKVGYQYYY